MTAPAAPVSHGGVVEWAVVTFDRARVLRQGGTTEIRVDRWPDPEVEFFVTSSQVPDPSDGRLLPFRDADHEAIARRLADGGRDRGRVLYLWQDRSFQGHARVAVALLHVERRQLQIRAMRVAAELRENPQRALQAAAVLLECVHALARADGQPESRVHWQATNRAEAEQILRDFRRPGVEMRIISQLGRGQSRAERAQVLLERRLVAG